jgi:putative sterol carrier protein
MSDATSEFFGELDRCGRERLLKTTTGTIRFDIEQDHEIDHWLVTINDGQVRVSREERDADTVVRTDRAFFDRLVRGEAEPLPAWLRNEITSEGSFRFVVLLKRLFLATPSGHHPRTVNPDGGGTR